MKHLLTVIITVALASGAVRAQSAQTPERPQNEVVEWLTPVRPSNKKQTPEEEEAGRRVGRDLPRPEILQPVLDPSLPSYQPRRDIKLTGSFKGSCSDTMPALVKLWIAAFAKYYPNVKIDVEPPFDGNFGARELAKGNIDFAIISRQLRPENITDFRNRFGYDPLTVPISNGSYRHFGFLDALGLFVNKDNPIEKISFGQLDALLSSTRHRGAKPITTWGQLGLTNEWADKPIHIYGIKPWDGIEDLIRQRVLSYRGQRGEWRPDIQFDSVFPTARRVADDRCGIGYTGLSYIDANVKMLPLGESDNGPFYAPTYENIALDRYPFNRVIFFNTNQPTTKQLNPALAEFLRFILSKEGQQLVLDHAIFLPFRRAQVQRSLALVR